MAEKQVDGTTVSSATAWLALFSSVSTLLCCALPALLVALGAGAVLASVINTFPGLVWVSEHKPLVFGAAALVLLLAGGMQWFARSLPCPLDPALAATCTRTRRWSLLVYWVSLLLYAIGGYFAFLTG